MVHRRRDRDRKSPRRSLGRAAPLALALLVLGLLAPGAGGPAWGGDAKAVASFPAPGRYTGKVGTVPSLTRKQAAANTLEILPPVRGQWHVRVHLEWGAGHLCDLAGPVEREPDGGLVYTETAANAERCELRIRARRGELWLADDQGVCRRLHCGNRGGLDGTRFSVRTRRPAAPPEPGLPSRR